MDPDFHDTDDGFDACAWCGGDFVPDDMDGEHCRQCAADLFGEDEL